MQLAWKVDEGSKVRLKDYDSTLRPYKDEWEAQLVERGERELALLAQLGHLEQTGNRENKRSKEAQKARSAT